MSTKTVKIAGWQRQQIPVSRDEEKAMILLINESVMGLFHESKLPLQTFACNLLQIYRRCQTRINGKDGLREQGAWRFPYRGKRTWDRRVNDAASEKHGAKIVAVTAGFYRPNVRLFQEA
jgi:hypothetical protein